MSDSGTTSSNRVIADYLEEIDPHLDELASLQGTYMANCKGPQGRIREIKTEMKDAGVDMSAFAEVLKDHIAERKRRKRVEALEPEARDHYEDMRASLGDYGDTPLGAAALDKARPPKRSGDETLDSLRG
jgi:hypothetical protein